MLPRSPRAQLPSSAFVGSRMPRRGRGERHRLRVRHRIHFRPPRKGRPIVPARAPGSPTAAAKTRRRPERRPRTVWEGNRTVRPAQSEAARRSAPEDVPRAIVRFRKVTIKADREQPYGPTARAGIRAFAISPTRADPRGCSRAQPVGGRGAAASHRRPGPGRGLAPGRDIDLLLEREVTGRERSRPSRPAGEWAGRPARLSPHRRVSRNDR